MARKKSNVKAKTTKKVAKKTQPKVVEEKQPEPEITGYTTFIFFQREPKDTNITAAAVFYNKNSGFITLDYYVAAYEHAIEMLVAGDVTIETAGNIKCISKADTPEEWIKNLVNSRDFSGNPFIAGEAEPTYEA